LVGVGGCTYAEFVVSVCSGKEKSGNSGYDSKVSLFVKLSVAVAIIVSVRLARTEFKNSFMAAWSVKDDLGEGLPLELEVYAGSSLTAFCGA
jgi:hypothetical protein